MNNSRRKLNLRMPRNRNSLKRKSRSKPRDSALAEEVVAAASEAVKATRVLADVVAEVEEPDLQDSVSKTSLKAAMTKPQLKSPRSPKSRSRRRRTSYSLRRTTPLLPEQ